jgi:hypothetical protein
MWNQLRAIAARIGLSQERVEAIEREGAPALVEDPRNSEIQYHVRADPDWTQRMSDAWHGTLVNSRRESAGTLPVPDGRLLIADPASPELGVPARVVPGDYEVVLTIAHLGSEETYDYEEHVSHAFALLRDNEGVATIEPMTDEDGTELGVDAATVAFASAGAIERIAAALPSGRILTIFDVLRSTEPGAELSDREWARAATEDGRGALVAMSAGYGREDYPLFRIADEKGSTIGVLADFFVDNRPY